LAVAARRHAALLARQKRLDSIATYNGLGWLEGVAGFPFSRWRAVGNDGDFLKAADWTTMRKCKGHRLVILAGLGVLGT